MPGDGDGDGEGGLGLDEGCLLKDWQAERIGDGGGVWGL